LAASSAYYRTRKPFHGAGANRGFPPRADLVIYRSKFQKGALPVACFLNRYGSLD